MGKEDVKGIIGSDLIRKARLPKKVEVTKLPSSTPVSYISSVH
jgi:hypothetical protein